ncbi:MAG: Fe-S protein assembly chaperone HscA [Alphaproteobacteria bacterium]|nr:Fe-S protein assembly chaperone HscA [Alphaproteobacteria bacterium]
MQIQEPGASDKKDELAVGIDFGTTNSLVAHSVSGAVKVLPDEHNKKKIPSAISITKEGNILVGTKALGVSDRDGVVTIKSIKRLIGKKSSDLDGLEYLKKYIQEDDEIKISANGLSMNTAEISTHILSKIKSTADINLEGDVKKSVITVPAYFDETQRRSVRFAAELAGLHVLRMINEPTAAALAYHLDEIKNGTYLVYDLGGGTFDVSLLKTSEGIVRVVATGGDSNFGGDDLDNIISNDLKKKFGDKTVENEDLIKYASQLKERLSYEDNIKMCFGDQTINFSRAELNNLIDQKISNTMQIVEDVVKDSSINKSEISGIILVGGSTRTLLIKSKLEENFSGVEFYDSINPDEVVAMGAAIHAENLVTGSGDLLLDVTPLSLGVELMGGIAEKIIHRNSPIPTSAEKEFTTYEDGQTGLKLHIIQGEREFAKDCRSLGNLELLGIPPMKAGVARIKVLFTIDADGLLVVTAKETSTNISQTISLIPTNGLDADAIEAALVSSMNNAKKDHIEKLLGQSRLYAKEMISKLMIAINEDNDLLSQKEYNSICSHIKNVQISIEGDDRSEIDDAVNELEDLTEEFISRQMQKHISIGLKGKKVEDIDKMVQLKN